MHAVFSALLPALPLLCVLASVAVLPQLWPSGWHDPWRRGACLLVAAAPAAALDAWRAPGRLGEAATEYVAFVTLLGCLYLLSACVRLRGHFAATPARNCALLAAGAALASLVGTTGASMLLVRPLLASNAGRRHVGHTVVFFIFLVSNVGGLLTPLGDPPLFLGYLHGVPFAWTLRLAPAWACVCAALLGVYFLLERAAFAREVSVARTRAADDDSAPGAGASAVERVPGPAVRALDVASGAQPPAAAHGVPLALEGRTALVGLVALLGLMVAARPLGLPFWPQQLGMWGIAAAVWWCTPAARRAANHFSWAPIVEVAQVFAAIFVAMPAALEQLGAHHAQLPLGSPTAFFWATGLSSSLLDNAPCYLAFATLAAQKVGLSAHELGALAAHPTGGALLEAIALGAVTMGAATYVGNGPNLMVRSMAEHAGVRTPSFLGYVGWAACTLVPVLACTQWLLYIARG